MGDNVRNQMDAIRRYAHLIEKQTGKAVRPYRMDGYVNLMNRYGTAKDPAEHYQFQREPDVPDDTLTTIYEGNGLFAKIIDTPAEEAIKHGFTLKDVSDKAVEDFVAESLDELDWEELAMTAIRWTRLFGGAIAVMLINDGGRLEDPLNWRNIKSIDDIRVYERVVVQPEYESMFNYDPTDPFSTRGSRLGMPEFYQVNSRYGNFRVHDSRCLVFQNGVLPENATNSLYQLWGIPEYIRIHRALKDAELAHESAPKLLDRSVQAIYKMRDLSQLLATEQGESQVLRRLQVIDMARGMLNSLVIDAEGEDYDFKTFQFNGITDVVSASCNMLSAITSIPQTILFGQGVGGMSSTDDTSMENYYNYVERIQKRMLRKNLRYLLSIIFQAGLYTGEVDEVPKLNVEFNPLWSMSDADQAALEQQKASTQLTKAQAAQAYVSMEAIDPSEVRKKLADSDEFDVETMLDELDDDDEDLFSDMPELEGEAGSQNPVEQNTAEKTADYAEGTSVGEHETDPGKNGSASPASAPAATKLPQDMSEEEKAKAAEKAAQNPAKRPGNSVQGDGDTSSSPDDLKAGVGVLVVKDGKILSGTRTTSFGYGLICGPGGHIKAGETPTQAAFRETEEEFGISPKALLPLGRGPAEPDTGIQPHIFLCTDYEGEPNCVDREMADPTFRTMEELEQLRPSLFQPFADDVALMKAIANGEAEPDGFAPFVEDGGPGSGNHGHEGIPGQVGGSAPSGKQLNDSIRNASKNGYMEVDKQVRSTLKDVPVGTKFTQKGVKYTKTAENEFTADNGRKATVNAIANGIDISSEASIPKFEDVKSSDIAAQKLENGELSAKKAAELVPPASSEQIKQWISDPQFQRSVKAGTDPKVTAEFESFIAKQKDFNGEAYRGVGFENTAFVDSLKAGDPIDMNGISSWSKFQDVASDYSLGWDEKPVGVVFRVRNPKGSAELPESGEGEVLLSGKSKLRVKKVSKVSDDGDYIVDVENYDGGPGSGNFGHEGVPGHVGGSAPSGDAKMSKDSFQKGKGDFELTGDVTDLYLTETARARVEGLVKTVKTASDLENYLKDQGIKLETSYEPLRNAMGKEIRSVKEQADYVIAAVEQYKDLGGLTALKAVHIYEPNLDAQAQYSYRAKGEEDVPDEGHLYISDRATGKQVMHEFAHAFADSTKPEGFDVVEWSAKLNKEAGLPDRAGTYLGANADVREAERFADAMGGALTYGEGTDNRLSFAANVANIVNGVQSKCDGGPGSGNFGHEGRAGEVGGSAPSLTASASSLLHKKSDDFKAEFLLERGMRFREVNKAMEDGKLDDLVDEKVREIAQERSRVADKAPDDSKFRKPAVKASLEIRNEPVEILVAYDKDGNEIGRNAGDKQGVKNSELDETYSTLHNHPGDADSCFSGSDVRSFANTGEQVMYMTSTSKLYSLQKTSDYDGYSARSVATHMDFLEKKYQDGDMTRNELIAETDLYLQLHAHEFGLVYKQQDVSAKNVDSEEKPLDFSTPANTIKSKGTSEDGGPGSGNHGHQGVPGQVGGSLPATTAEALKEAIATGSISTKLSRSKQSKHKKGTAKYNRAVAKGYHVSYMTVDDDEIESIVKTKSGTGKPYGGGQHFKETVDAGKPVGVYLNERGEEKETTRVTIHYGSADCHVVPASPKKG